MAPIESLVPDPACFIDRTTELQRLAQAFHTAVSSRRPQFLLVEGDVGIGKTVLVEAFLASLPAHTPPVLVGRGRCALETERNGLVPFSEALAGLACPTVQSDKMRLVTGTAWDFIQEVAPAWLNLITGGLAEPLAVTIKAGTKLLSPTKYGEDSVFLQFTNALGKLAEHSPLILFLDDLHWADESSLRLLFHVQRNLLQGAVLFLGTCRAQSATLGATNALVFSEVRANLIRNGAQVLPLADGIDVGRYVARRYPENTFGPDLLARVQEATDGHPLFLDQLFDLWESTGVLQSVPGAGNRPVWRFAQNGEVQIAVPMALAEVLAQRLRRMEDVLRNSLVYAAVEGEEFTAQVLAQLQRTDELAVFDQLQELEQEHHLVEESKAHPAVMPDLDYYRFGQRFVREYIYQQLPTGKRRILHRQVADYLAVLYARGEAKGAASRIAWHYGEAHEPRKAATYAADAAREEQRRYAWAEAEKWCRFGLGEIENESDRDADGLRLDLLETSALGFLYSANLQPAHKRLQEALKLAEAMGIGAERTAELWAHSADILESEGRYAEAVHAIAQGEAQLGQAPLSEASIRLRWMSNLMLGRCGNAQRAIEGIRRLLADAETLPSTANLTYLLVRIYNSLSVMLYEVGRCRESLATYGRGLNLSTATREERLLPTLWLNSVAPHLMLHDAGQSRACIEQGLADARRIGDLDSLAFAQAEQAEHLLVFGNPQDALAQFTAALAEAERIESFWNVPHLHTSLALAHLALGDDHTARLEAERGVAGAREVEYRWEEGYARTALGRILATQGCDSEAQEQFDAAISIHAAAGQRACAALTKRYKAQLLADRGAAGVACTLLAEAAGELRELELDWEAEATEQLLHAVQVQPM